jgi:putative transposase
MGSVRDAYDDVLCEFFATLECELLDRCRFRTQAEARMAVFEYLEGWYNPHRRRSVTNHPLATNGEPLRRRESHNAHPSHAAGQ